MTELPDHSLARRGTWIGLRTLRQRPKLVDQTEGGDPIFEVRSVRLLLRADADHFNRLERCSKCGRLVPGAPVYELADLDRPANPLICTSCVRAVAKQTALRPIARPADPEAAPAPDSEPVDTDPIAEGGVPPQPGTEAAAAPPPDPLAGGTADRLGAMERRLEAMSTRVEQLSRLVVAQETAMEEGRRADEAARTALQTAMTAAVADARAEMAAAEASATKVTGLAQVVESQRVDINAIASAVGQVRTDVARVVEANQQVAQAHAEAQQRASYSAEQAASVQAAVDQRLQQLGEQLARATARIDALVTLTEERAGRVHALEQRVEQLIRMPPTPVLPEVAGPAAGGSAQLLQSLERQLQGASSRLAALSGSRRTDLDIDPESRPPPRDPEHGGREGASSAR